ncbi:MAG: hypothetical protein NZZ41_07275, partial [Candidatus Dojkabacteria bacterium]|nr:hypothetical protein [Candidatus Dojkabacteria bacterium]
RENYMLSNIVILYGSSGSGKTHFLENMTSYMKSIGLSYYLNNSFNPNMLYKANESHNMIIFDNAENVLNKEEHDEPVVPYFLYYQKFVDNSTIHNVKKRNNFYIFSLNDEKALNYLMKIFDLNFYIDFDVFTENDVRDICNVVFSRFEIDNRDLLFDYVCDFVLSKRLNRKETLKVVKNYLNNMYYSGNISNYIDVKDFIDFMYASSI